MQLTVDPNTRKVALDQRRYVWKQDSIVATLCQHLMPSAERGFKISIDFPVYESPASLFHSCGAIARESGNRYRTNTML